MHEMPEPSPSTQSATAPRAFLAGAFIACVGLLTSAGCAGASFESGIYSDRFVTYRVGRLDSRWRRVQVEDNDLAFHRPHWGTISVNSTCTDYEDVPATALLNHLLFETTDRQTSVDEVVALDGRGAKHVVMSADLDGVPLELELYILKKDGCVFDLSQIRSPAAPIATRAAFGEFVKRFRVIAVRNDD